MLRVCWLLRCLPAVTSVLLLGLGDRAHAAAPAQVVLVRLSDAPAHQAVERAFRETFPGPVRVVTTASRDLALELQQARTEGASAIVAIGSEAARRAAESRTGLPLVVTLDPGLAGAAATGTAVVATHASPERQVELLREALPEARRVGFLYDPRQSEPLAQRYAQAARAVGLEVVTSVVERSQQVVPVARALMDRVDALWLLPDSTVVTAESFRLLVRRSFEAKVPLVGYSEGMCRGGALLALEVGPAEMAQHAVAATQRMLAGGPPSVDPSEGTLCVNARAARMLQVPLPSSLVGRASRLIEQ